MHRKGSPRGGDAYGLEMGLERTLARKRALELATTMAEARMGLWTRMVLVLVWGAGMVASIPLGMVLSMDHTMGI